MENRPSPLSGQLRSLRSNAWAPRENRALLPASLHALIAAIFARIFARLELLLQAWQTGSLPPPPIKSRRNPMPRQSRAAPRTARHGHPACKLAEPAPCSRARMASTRTTPAMACAPLITSPGTITACARPCRARAPPRTPRPRCRIPPLRGSTMLSKLFRYRNKYQRRPSCNALLTRRPKLGGSSPK